MLAQRKKSEARVHYEVGNSGRWFSGGTELKKIKLSFKDQRQLFFFIFKALLFILMKKKLFTETCQEVKYL